MPAPNPVAAAREVSAAETLYEELEQPLVPVLLRMEHLGVLVDRELLRAQSREFGTQMLELTTPGTPGGRHRIQHGLTEAAAADPV